ncbi:MAG: hypothetical protein ACRECN_06615, partial [Methylocella sp.]
LSPPRLTSRNSRCSLALLFWRPLPVLDSTACDIDDKLGGLTEIAWALGMFVGHDRNYKLDCP